MKRNCRYNVTGYLDMSAERNPGKTAVICENRKYTYRQLADDSKAIATGLANFNVVNMPIAVYMEKGYETLCAFMGIARARAFYVMINMEHPAYRVNQIMETLEGEYVITDKSHLERAKILFEGKKVLLIEELIKIEPNNEKLKVLEETMLDTDPLYANFTSGSTGTPKGVLIGHSSVIDFIDVFCETFGFTADDIIANQAPWDFDVSTKDIYTALATGATLLIVPREKFSKPVELVDYIENNRATVLIWAVSALCLMTTFHCFEYRSLTTVRKVLFSGEVMPWKHMKQWRDHLPEAMFVNLYGPTEITCNCTYHVMEKERDYEQGIPIGKPFRNEHVFLLDENDSEITSEELGKIGEICVKGRTLGLGYYNSQQQTEEAFVQNPLNHKYLELIYRTRDLGKYDKDGNIVFSGRKDFQIKYLGHRIELEEIERNINGIDRVNRCCCIFDDVKHRLYAYYIGDIDKEEITLQLKEKVPYYMIPSKLVKVEEFPLNKNGKVDRKELKHLKEK